MNSLFQVLWTRLDQTTSQDSAYGTSVDSIGNVLVAGYTNGNLNGNNNKGYSDGFVSKYSPDGTLLWTVTQGGASYDASAAVATDALNNVYVLTGIDGYYHVSQEPIGGAGAYSALISKYDPNGILLNSVSIDINFAPFSMSVSPEGDVLIAGSNEMWPRAYIAFLSRDYIVSDGTSPTGFWQDTSIQGGSPATAVIGSLFLNSNFYIAGCVGTDGFIAKYDMSGNKIWQDNIQANLRAQISAIATDNQGGIYVTGFAGEISGAGYTSGMVQDNASGPGGVPNRSSTDSFLAKYSESGALIWIKEFGTSNDDAAQSITIDSNGNIYVGGYTDRTFGATALAGTDAKPFISVFNKDGELLWSEIYSATTGDILGLSSDNSGHVFAVGATDKNINGLVALESSGKNGLVMKLAYITGTTIADTIVGTDGDDVIYGLEGNDNLIGGSGNDDLIGGKGNDTLNGGDGFDTADYSQIDSGVRIDLGGNKVIGLTSTSKLLVGTDKTSNIENAIGGSGNDTLIASRNGSELEGGDGNDTLKGGSKSDTLYGGDGNDIVSAGSGNDIIIGGDGAGDDSYDGGSGIDSVRYSSATSGITVDLTLKSANAISTLGSDLAGIGTDKLTNIENIIAGDYDDTLIGNKLKNQMEGGDGNDTLNGGLGNDTLIGGDGEDTFIFNTKLNKSSNVDTIADFNQTDDEIQLALSIFTNIKGSDNIFDAYDIEVNTWAANQKVNATSDAHLIFNTSNHGLYYDADGSGKAAAVHFASLASMTSIEVTDFFLI
jgi:Ca2+-binding RTX toxin-like protein